jgi:hypothetical protein
MAWPVEFMQFIIFGQADGKVRSLRCSIRVRFGGIMLPRF